VFTGIIEEVGLVRSLESGRTSAELEIEAKIVLEGTRVGDSIATSGVCLTVTRLGSGRFWADAMPETVRRTTLGGLRAGAPVNLERALEVGSRLGGHLVTGHIDGTGAVARVVADGNASVLTLRVPPAVAGLSVAQGSITVDGVSLTVVRVEGDTLAVSLIPHTMAATTLATSRAGDLVNLEADLVGRYVHSYLARGSAGEGLTWEKLVESGLA
jgi:riboflavin synthase